MPRSPATPSSLREHTVPVPYRNRLLLLGWGLTVLVLTLVPDPSPEASGSFGFFCLVCGSRGTADAILNAGLFLPLGALVGRRGVGHALVAGAAFSLGIELAQTMIPGRFPTMGDVVFNTLGAGFGALLVGVPRRTLSWSAPWALLGLIAPPFLLPPSVPDAVLFGQWTAEFGNLEVYDGRVLEAEVGGIPLPDGPSPRSDDLAHALENRAGIRVRFLAGTPPAGLAPVFSIYDDRRRETVLLGADGVDLVFRMRTRADLLRLDHPEWRAAGALTNVSEGDSVLVEATWSSGSSPCLSLNRSTQCAVAPGFAAGWSLLLHPSPLASNALTDWLWAALMAFPLGWVLGGRTRGFTAGLALTSVLLGISVLSPDMRVTVGPGLALLAGAIAGGLAAERWA